MKYLCTAVFWLVFLVFAPLEFLVGVGLLLVMLPFDPNRRALHAFICRWTFLYLRIFPTWRIRVTGRELLPRGPAVLVVNHQSMADVVAVMGLHHPFKFVSKASLFKLPLVGWTMRMLRYVSLERGKPRSTHRMMEACRHWLRRGEAVLLFPEGTYSMGSKMLPFKRGAFLLAIEEKVPLVPVALSGTAELVEGDGPWMNPRANIRLTVLPPIPPAELGEDADALSQLVRERLEAALAAPRS